MKMLLALMLVSVALCTETDYSYDSLFFDQLRSTEFGKTMIETIQLEMGGSADEVLEMLRQMEASLQAEQKAELARSRSQAQSCGTKQVEVSNRLNAASTKKAEDEQQLPLLLEEQKDKERQANDKYGEEQRNLDRIHVLTGLRQESRAEYEARRDELSGLAAALQEARRIIAQLKAPGSSFLQTQTSQVFVELKNHHAKVLRHYPNQRGFHSFVTLLLETTQDPGVQANQQGVAKLLGVMDELVESIFELQRQEMAAEDARQQDFLIQKARLELANTRLQGTIAHLKAKVEIITQTILELNNDIATNSEVVEQKGQELKDWVKTCDDQQRAYELQEQNRKEQADVIAQCIVIFETRFESAQALLQKMRV